MDRFDLCSHGDISDYPSADPCCRTLETQLETGLLPDLGAGAVILDFGSAEWQQHWV